MAAGPFTPRNEHGVTHHELWYHYMPESGNWHDMNCGITTYLNRAIGMMGLSPIGFAALSAATGDLVYKLLLSF
jgi:hypothetical protein